MGFTPQQVRLMSLWDLGQAWAGWKRANGAKDVPKGVSDAEFERTVAEASFDDVT